MSHIRVKSKSERNSHSHGGFRDFDQPFGKDRADHRGSNGEKHVDKSINWITSLAIDRQMNYSPDIEDNLLTNRLPFKARHKSHGKHYRQPGAEDTEKERRESLKCIGWVNGVYVSTPEKQAQSKRELLGMSMLETTTPDKQKQRTAFFNKIDKASQMFGDEAA